MKPFQYIRPKTIKEAVNIVASTPEACFIAGGTNLLDLMKRGIETPEKLVDINHLPLKKIEQKNGITRIGALVSNHQAASHHLIIRHNPLLVQAINAGASGQLRNMATIGGNLLQRTHCPYFYDAAFPCNKRNLGDGCGAINGINRTHAIFEIDKSSNHSCIAVHPSDMAVALIALDAKVILMGKTGERQIPLTEFYKAPHNSPDIENVLENGELITAVDIPESSFDGHIHYLKVRDRSSYAFALTSVATALKIQNGQITGARVTLGGVAYKPWRLPTVEKALVGKSPSESLFRQVAELALDGAVALEHNAYKLKLIPNIITESLKTAARIP